MKCPFCQQKIRTQIIKKPEFISILLGFALFVFLPNFIMLIFTVIVLQVTSTRKHRCPICEKQLGSDGQFLVFFKDQVYSFKFGSNGIIISKKILASIGIVVCIFIILSIKASRAYADVQFTEMTWAEFNQKCPYTMTSPMCLYGHEGQTVKNWRGFVMRVQDNRNSIKRHFRYAVALYIKMSDMATLQIRRQMPDIFLTMTSFQLRQYNELLDKMSHGDQIEFNATFQHLRNTRNLPSGRHLNIIEFKFTGLNNPNIHIYMSQEEDAWFFLNFAGRKLRKHAEEKNQNTEEKIQKSVQEELKMSTENLNPTQKQKQVIEDNLNKKHHKNDQTNKFRF